MMNITILIGRITATPEIRKTQGGASMCRFQIAVPRDKKVEGQTDTDFFPVVAWNKTAENLCLHTHKGSQICVAGQLQTRNYQNAQGTTIYVTEVHAQRIQYLDPKNMNDGVANTNAQTNMAYVDSQSNITSENVVDFSFNEDPTPFVASESETSEVAGDTSTTVDSNVHLDFSEQDDSFFGDGFPF